MSFNSILLSLLFTAFVLNASAQELHFAEIGINGLHCSACTFSVEKSINKLEFVSVVQMDLNKRSGKIYFKENVAVNYERLAKAVVDAGFSVRTFDLVYREKLEESISCIGTYFCVVGKEMDQGNRLRIIGKEFQEKKAFRAARAYLEITCENCADSPGQSDSSYQRFKVILL